MVLLTAVAGATVTSPPEKRQASITAVSECHMDGTVKYVHAKKYLVLWIDRH
jgi:hypothetical protein